MIHATQVSKLTPVVPLGQVAEFLDHQRKPVKESERQEGEFPYYGANGQQGTISDYLFDEPLVLLAEDGGYFDEPDRGVAYKISGKTWVNNHAHVLRPTAKVDIGFLTRHLERYDLLPFVNGSTRSKLTKANAERIPIWLPPLPEQRRIAAILDKADAIRRKREQGIRLTEELLRSTFLEMFGDPVRNQKGWPRKPLSEVLANIDSGWSPKCHDRPAKDGEWAILKLGAVTFCKYQPEENKALPETEPHQPELEVKQGDLLMTRKNTYELVAACAFVFETPPRLMLPDLIFRLRIQQNAPVRAEYLWGLLTHPGKRQNIQSLAGGSAGSMPNISKAKLLSHLIELPPTQLQDKFAKLMHSHYRMMRKRLSLVTEQDLVFGSLVQRAFRGEL